MVIDCEKKLNEKQAKELKSSLNYMIDNLLQQKGERFSFSIQFDNGSVYKMSMEIFSIKLVYKKL